MIQKWNIPPLSALSIRSVQVLMHLLCWSCIKIYGTVCWVTEACSCHRTDSCGKYHGYSLLLPRLHLSFRSGWHTLTLQFLIPWIQFWPFLANRYDHLPNCLSSVQTYVSLKHSTMAQGFFAVCLLDHLQHFTSGFA
jgi:hypothetical protein